MTIDASAFAIGVVLFQDPIAKDLSIGYGSRTQWKIEMKYSTIERKLKVNKNRDVFSRIKINTLTDYTSVQSHTKVTFLAVLPKNRHENDKAEKSETEHDNNETPETETPEVKIQSISEEFKTMSLTDYSKIKFSNSHFLDYTNIKIFSQL